jgi:hypothetical protein
MAKSRSCADGATYLALEVEQTRYLGPLPVIQHTTPVQEQVAAVFDFDHGAVASRLLHLHEPLAFLVLPITAHDLCIEDHVFS